MKIRKKMWLELGYAMHVLLITMIKKSPTCQP